MRAAAGSHHPWRNTRNLLGTRQHSLLLGVKRTPTKASKNRNVYLVSRTTTFTVLGIRGATRFDGDPWSKCTTLKIVLATLLGGFGARALRPLATLGKPDHRRSRAALSFTTVLVNTVAVRQRHVTRFFHFNELKGQKPPRSEIINFSTLSAAGETSILLKARFRRQAFLSGSFPVAFPRFAAASVFLSLATSAIKKKNM